MTLGDVMGEHNPFAWMKNVTDAWYAHAVGRWQPDLGVVVGPHVLNDDDDLPSIYKAAPLGGGFWSVEGPNLGDMPLFREEYRARTIERALNQAYALGHTYGRGAGK